MREWPFGSLIWVKRFHLTFTESKRIAVNKSQECQFHHFVFSYPTLVYYLVFTVTWGRLPTVCFLQKSQRPTSSMRTGWPWRCSCSSLSTTIPPASMWPSSKANLWGILVNTHTCLANWGMRRWVFLPFIGKVTLFTELRRISLSKHPRRKRSSSYLTSNIFAYFSGTAS